MHKSRYLFILFLLCHFSFTSAARASSEETPRIPFSAPAPVHTMQALSNSSTSSTDSQEKTQAAHAAAKPIPNLNDDQYEGWQPGKFIIPGTNTQVPCKYLMTSFNNLGLCITEHGMFERSNCIDWKQITPKAQSLPIPTYKPIPTAAKTKKKSTTM